MGITLFPDGRILHSNGVEIGSTKMMDQWRLTQSKTIPANTSTYLDSNWERNDKNAGASQIGAGMSVDSNGIWTFPTTGKYMIVVHLNNRANSGDNTYLGLKSTTNNSTYIECKRFQTGSSGGNGNSHSGSGEYFINVTDTSQVKIKYYPMSLQSGSYFEGSDAHLQSTITYTRLSS